MNDGLKEFDDNMDKCCFCYKPVSRSDDWCLAWHSMEICHRKCNSEYMQKASQI